MVSVDGSLFCKLHQRLTLYLPSPNGKDCKYRHALPPGFVLKKKESEEERREREAREKSNQITIEDFLEKEVFIEFLFELLIVSKADCLLFACCVVVVCLLMGCTYCIVSKAD